VVGAVDDLCLCNPGVLSAFTSIISPSTGMKVIVISVGCVPREGGGMPEMQGGGIRWTSVDEVIHPSPCTLGVTPSTSQCHMLFWFWE